MFNDEVEQEESRQGDPSENVGGIFWEAYDESFICFVTHSGFFTSYGFFGSPIRHAKN